MLLLLIPLIFVLALAAVFHFNLSKKLVVKEVKQPQKINIDGKTLVKYPQDYTMVMVGDSMTEKLGNSDEIRDNLKKYCPNKTFEILNYGFGSTNILSVQERLQKETFYGRSFRPILDIAFDLILIESFGNNPLSQFPLDVGLKKQTEALDKIVATIKKANPTAKIVFVATISPNKWRYGDGTVTLDLKQKAKWVNERVAYIKNHMEYAKAHGIPLINIYEKSLNSEGDGNLDYLSSDDFIHPSPNGVYLISEEIAKFIFEQKVLSP